MNQSFPALGPIRLAVLASIVGCAPLHAAPGDPEVLRPIVVTSSGTPQTLGSEVAATSVLTRDEIERAGVRDVVSALQLLGASQVEQLGGPGATAVVRLRGGESRDTLVLVDGVPIADVTTGQASISQIPIDWIERIEVVRGNVSALYGSNATGGVIQIFTRRGAPGAQGQLTVGAGSRGTRWSQAAVSGGNERVRARAAVGVERANGFSAVDPSVISTANGDDDGYRRRDSTLAVDADLADGHSIGADVREFFGRTDYDDPSSFGSPTDLHQARIAQRAAALRGRHRLSTDWSLGWRLAASHEHRSDDSVTGFGASNFGNNLNNKLAAVDVVGSLGSGWGLTAGLEHQRQATENATYLQQERRIQSVRAGGTYSGAWGGVQLNVRHDRVENGPSATTGLVGGTWKLGGGFSAVGNVASSFTLPTLDFLYFDCSPFGYSCSNPDLQPEKARNLDLGLQWEEADTLIRATLFTARYRDKIVNDANFIPQNVARARDRGLELSARTRVQGWRLSGEALIHDPENETTGQRLPRRAGHQFAVRVDRDWTSSLSSGVTLRRVGSRTDTSGQDLSAYTLLDLSGQWAPSRQWLVKASLQNAFDRSYAPAFGYNGVPRGVFLSATWTPGR